ncbi:hypothetical protein EC396_14305, partial [Lutibacter sp. HS1-25]
MSNFSITAQNNIYIQGPTKAHQGEILTYTLNNPNGDINPNETYWYWEALNNDFYYYDENMGSSTDIEFNLPLDYDIGVELYDDDYNYIDGDYLTVTVIPEIPNTPPNPTVLSSTTGSVTLQRTDSPQTDMDITWYWQSSSNGTSTSNGSGTTKVVTTGTTYYLRAYNSHSGLWSTDSGWVSYTVPTLQTWYQDSDGDGLGDPNNFINQTSKPTGYVSNSDDECPLQSGTLDNNGCPVVSTPLSDQNYVYTITPTKGVNKLGLLSNNEFMESVNYYDGLGRPIQSIAIRAGG